jgi:hypothetical protein
MNFLDAWKAQIEIEQEPVLTDGLLDLKSLYILELRHNRKSTALLKLVDELDRRIAIATTDKRSLHQARSNAAQEFAKHLDANPSPLRQLGFDTDDGRYVFIVFQVLGNPPRTAFKQAEKWMAARGQTWTGNSTRLRAAVLKALQSGERLPPGNFGFRVERTIRFASEFADGLRVELPNCFKPK